MSSWTKSSSGFTSVFVLSLAAAWRGRFSPVWQKVFHTFETGNTAYFVLWSYHSKTSWVVLGWNIPAFTQNIISDQWSHVFFQFFSHGGKFFRTIHFEVNEKEHVTWPTWPFWALQMVTRASPKFKFFSHKYHNYSMFRDVPCSWFYRRPLDNTLDVS